MRAAEYLRGSDTRRRQQEDRKREQPAPSQGQAAPSQGRAAPGPGRASPGPGDAAPSQGKPAKRGSRAPGVPGSSRYRCLDEGEGLGSIGAGRFGNVYIAHDRDRNKLVAIKRQSLPSASAARELAFYKSLAPLPHPNVTQLLDEYCTPGYLYMVFDLMDRDLWSVWTARRRLVPAPDARDYLRQLLLGLSHMHGVQVIHTDLSMANVMVGIVGSEPGTLRITDFGGAAHAHLATLKSAEVITTEYVRAPEIFLGAKNFTTAVDMWAAGVTGVALLCGELLFWRTEPWSEPHFAMEARSLLPGGWPSVLANMATVLIPPAPPEFQQLPHWGLAAGVMARRPHYSGLADALADASLVRRPAETGSDVTTAMAALLRWRPKDRPDAEAVLGLSLFADPKYGEPRAAMASQEPPAPSQFFCVAPGARVFESWAGASEHRAIRCDYGAGGREPRAGGIQPQASATCRRLRAKVCGSRLRDMGGAAGPEPRAVAVGGPRRRADDMRMQGRLRQT